MLLSAGGGGIHCCWYNTITYWQAIDNAQPWPRGTHRECFARAETWSRRNSPTKRHGDRKKPITVSANCSCHIGVTPRYGRAGTDGSACSIAGGANGSAACAADAEATSMSSCIGV